MTQPNACDRRTALMLGLGGAAGLLAARAHARQDPPPPSTSPRPSADSRPEEEISPAEDLMYEHGVLNRAMLIYEECARRIDAREDLPPEALAGAAELIRTYIEDHHERMEEEHLFPRFRAAGRLVPLVDLLVVQHRAGRRVTDGITALATARSLRDPDDSREVRRLIAQFITMYRPHEAREDTVLFPALFQVLTPHEYDALREEFERVEREQLGGDSFDQAVERVTEIERDLGIYDLAKFTPRV